MTLAVLASGPDWVVVDKPPGLLVHRMLPSDGPAAVQVLRDQLGRHVWPVHRLDRATSGGLLFALDRDAVDPLHQALGSGRKWYLAQVRGDVAAREPVEVDEPLEVDGKSHPARTTLLRLAGAADPRSSLVLAQPHTGRYHQVRRHLAHRSHPVLGDAKHGDTRVNRWWRDHHGLPRLALHCWRIEATLPDGTALSVRAPIPHDLDRLWRAQPWWEAAEAALVAHGGQA